MGKALYGTMVPSLQLLDEVQTLRRRVAELEAALARAEAARVEPEPTKVVDISEQALTAN